jgi:hypothetical protein
MSVKMINDVWPDPMNPIGKNIEGVLELSADAQIRQRQAVQDSIVFHELSGAIAAYGKVLRLLTRVQELPGSDYLLVGEAGRSAARCEARPT